MLFNSLKLRWNLKLKMYREHLLYSILIMLVLFSSSCITTSKSCDCNEQIKVKKYKRFKKKHQLSFHEVIKHRDSLMLATKQVTDEIDNEKNKTGFVSAIQLNKLYQVFGEQVHNDLLLESYLKKRETTDSTFFLKQIYGAQLLLSWAKYEQTIINRGYGFTINQGDLGNYIPSQILADKLQLLYSPHFRKRLFNRPPLPQNYLLDSIKNQLPEENLRKQLYYTLIPLGGIIKNLVYWSYQTLGKEMFKHHNIRDYDRKTVRSVATQLLDLLEPFDILITKSPEPLTNQIIPGYFTHAAIWVGSGKFDIDGDFKEMKTKKSDVKIALHSKGLCEALTSGVQMSNIKECSKNEVIAIFRFKKLNTEIKKRMLENMGKQIGKCYDFSFNFESSDRVNCTELVFLCFDFVTWKYEQFFNKNAIYPDNLIETALLNNDFEIIAVFKKGNLIIEPKKMLQDFILNED